jgi:hypothetical protein
MVKVSLPKYFIFENESALNETNKKPESNVAFVIVVVVVVVFGVSDVGA